MKTLAAEGNKTEWTAASQKDEVKRNRDGEDGAVGEHLLLSGKQCRAPSAIWYLCRVGGGKGLEGARANVREVPLREASVGGKRVGRVRCLWSRHDSPVVARDTGGLRTVGFRGGRDSHRGHVLPPRSAMPALHLPTADATCLLHR